MPPALLPATGTSTPRTGSIIVPVLGWRGERFRHFRALYRDPAQPPPSGMLDRDPGPKLGARLHIRVCDEDYLAPLASGHFQRPLFGDVEAD